MHENERNIDIEALRALAIILVLALHLLYFTRDLLVDSLPHLQLWQGVDLFFVISGYLITGLLQTVKSKFDHRLPWKHDLKAFWVRRAFRLLPAAWVWILIPIAMAVIWEDHPLVGSLETVSRDALAAFTNTANLYWAYCIGTIHWGEFCSRAGILGVYWSLSQEEQFYLLLPLLILILTKRALTLTLLLSIVILFFLHRPVFSLGWYMRPDGLIWGVLLAMHGSKIRNLAVVKYITAGRKKAFFLTLLILALISAPSLLEILESPVSAISLISLVSAALVFLCTCGTTLTPPGLARRVLSWIGSRSYALYLAHWPIYCALRILFLPQNLSEQPQIITAIIFTLAWCLSILLFAELTFRYIETPCRLHGRKIANNYSITAYHPVKSDMQQIKK